MLGRPDRQANFNAPIERQAAHRARRRPNVLSTPRMWFDNRVVMPTSCDRAPNKARARWAAKNLTCTGRYHPVRMICAKPSTSF